MRTVTGPSDHVVVVGAGLGGLSAALRLVAAGRQVTVLERSAVPGGLAGLLELDGYRFDTGPTVLTLPHLVAEALNSIDEELGDWVQLQPLDPAYRATFADGSAIAVHSDVERMAEEVARTCGPRSADGYRRLVAAARAMYDVELPHFIDRNVDSPRDLLSAQLLQLIRLGGFRRLGPLVERFLPDERLRRIFSFQALYAGLSPYDALGLYLVIAYMDCVAGVYAPVGGIHGVARGLAGAAAKHGVQFRYDTEAQRVEFAGDRAVAVHTTDGERIGCDAVVLNTDIAGAWRTLLLDRRRPVRSRRRLRYSPSCFVLHAGAATPPPDAQHTIVFGNAWRRTFAELIDQKVVMSDPSLLVSCPTVTDPAVAPAGRSAFYVLAPTPNLDAGIDWDQFAPHYREQVVARLEARGFPGFGAAIEVEAMTTPADWARAGLERGTPFSAAHTFGQTGPFRAPNLAFDNVVFAGAGTHPGVGVPMVLVSGRLAAERITGATGRVAR